MAKKKAARSYHHGQLREALIESALELIRESGSAGLTLREVAKRAGVSHAAPYRHYADRAALVAAVAAEGFRKLGVALKRAADKSSAGAPRVRALGLAYVRFATSHPAHFQVMFSDEAGSDEAAAAGQAAMAYLVEAIETGKIAPGDARIQVLTAWSTVHGLATLINAGQVAAGTRREVETLVGEALATLLAGLAR